VIRALSRAKGRRMDIGVPRFWIISCPTARNVSGDSWLMVRLRENQVPQNTPMTRAKRTMVMTWATRVFTALSSARADLGLTPSIEWNQDSCYVGPEAPPCSACSPASIPAAPR
jgi:hypothetical protein